MPINDPLHMQPLNPDPHATGASSSASENPPGAGSSSASAGQRHLDIEPIHIEPIPMPEIKPVPVGIPIEHKEPPPGGYSVQELDVCPSCGAPMRGADTLVCTRCG